MNNINLIGRLVKDVELKRTQTGVAVAQFNLAVDGGKEETYFFTVIAWKELAETIVKFVKKGHRVGISGRLTQRSYEKDGQKRQVHEIVAERVDFLEPKEKAEEHKEEEYDPSSDLPF